MKLGITEWSVHRNCGRQQFGRPFNNPKPWTVTDFVEFAAASKLDGIQLESIPEEQPGIDALRSKIESLSLYVEVEAGVARPAAFERLSRNMRAAKSLGAKIVRIFPAINRCNKELSLAQLIAATLENLKKVGGLAEQLDLLVGIENHGNMVYEKVDNQDISAIELMEMLDRLNHPRVGVCIDTGNCLFHVEDPIETAKLLAPRVFTVHLKDYKIKRLYKGCEVAGCVLGTGCIDLPAILKILKEKSPQKNDLRLNIECPLEHIPVPFLDDSFWDSYPPKDAMRIPSFLKFLSQRGCPAEAVLKTPSELGRSVDDVLEIERRQNIESIAPMRSLLASL